eukprot:CAMPEP_0201639180 /NCGR_PEP_ID=MMETSP0493-20130528/18581_1 /ASSEMBLY_ACC=CAM_ASM_000838 /TAXON_ID=420259 /ORGANISM="Thalassiosira gravida, Strain GMp14c1" /LENGTH=154 /DNA_ID=CAMNT_0048112489 /DNA_START=217 /DNA_END=681 /DNA_ORIENTATION=-
MSDLEVMEFSGTNDDVDIAILCIFELLMLVDDGDSMIAFNVEDALALPAETLLLSVDELVIVSSFNLFPEGELRFLPRVSRALNPLSPTFVSPADAARNNTPRRNGVLDLHGSFFPELEGGVVGASQLPHALLPTELFPPSSSSSQLCNPNNKL